MGEPVGDEHTAGDDCNICWGLGKPFGIGSTPYQIYLTWADIPFPLDDGNGIYIGTQNPVNANQWLFDNEIFEGKWTYNGGTLAQIQRKPAGGYIFANGGNCSLICTAIIGYSCTIS